MNTQPTTSSFIVRAAVLLLTVFTTTGAWAQNPTSVSTEKQLTDAIADGAGNIQLAGDILLSKYLDIDGKTVAIDLNGHKLSRNLNSYGNEGHVIWAHNGSNLTLTSSVVGGSIEGGMANNGGAIHIPHGNTVTTNNITFRNNSAAGHAGAIWNNGTFTATNCTFENNKASDVGAIYNAVTSDGAGTATLTGCTFTGNAGTTGAGALANALGATVMTIDGGTITGNTADTYGAGIWNGGTLNMKGAITVKDNTNAGGMASNVYLKSGKVITVTGSLAGSTIGVDLESVSGKFTSGYNSYNNGVAPETLFTADHSSFMDVIQNDGEAELASWYPNPLSFIERSWDGTNKKVINTEKVLTALIDYGKTPDAEWQYKEVTNAPSDEPDQWFGMGGYSSTVPEYYVVRGNVNRETIVVQGSDVHLILCNDATLTLTGGLKLEGDNKLYIHCQSYGGAMGRLMVTTKYSHSAGIGSAFHNYKENKAGELVIHGGHIEAEGGKYSAGIGSTKRFKIVGEALCKSVTVYGGYVRARGGTNAAGIGGGQGVDGEDFILYDGTVIAEGDASGVGGGQEGDGGTVTVYGGSLTATGGGGAGIGSGNQSSASSRSRQCGGTFTIFDGTVIANGGGYSAGIGGGSNSGGAEVIIYDGTVIATGGDKASGIGGGYLGFGGTLTISGGTVTATGGEKAAGIGGGSDNYGGTVNISGGTVTAIGGEKAAGIGGGYDGRGGDVTITGGTVIASAGDQGGVGNRAIGPGREKDVYGTLTIGNAMMVGAGNNGSVERTYDADERKNACWYRSYAELSPCTHPSGITFTINDSDTHTSHCKHCSVSETAEHFNSDGSGTCVCGYKDGNEYHTITIATSSNDTYYEGVGVMANVGNDKPYTLPVCSTFPDGYDFAGWVVNPQSHNNGIRPNEGETLLPAGENITVTANVTIFARYRALEISLADDGDNHETIYNYDGRKATTVTLTGRTFYKDGNWNTLCLPFAVTDGDATDGVTFSGTPFEGATVLTLDNATFENSTLTLNFEETSAMEPGKPYLVKWASDTEHPTIFNPVFNDVTISNTSTSDKAVVAGIVTFTGQYAPLKIGEEGDLTILYLGADNTFRYPDGAMDINAFRAYIHANTSLGDVNGDGVVNVTDVTLLVDYILGKEVDDSFIFENADVTRDGTISVTDVTALVDLILGGNSIVKMVVNGADGITFGGGGNEPARVAGTTYQDD